MNLEVVILAAGQGTRMRSTLPKVLHPVAGRPMLARVIDTAWALQPKALHAVIGHGADRVREQLAEAGVNWVLQKEQLGTGHAVAQALPEVAEDSVILVLYGDVPLVREDSLRALLAAVEGDRLGLLTVVLDDPSGYGRILRDDSGAITGIVEQKDASEVQRQLREANSGILAATAAQLRRWLPALSDANAQGEYYLTDIVAMAVADNIPVVAQTVSDPWEVQGVNDRVQLNQVERHYQRREAETLLRAGASLADAGRFDVRGELEVGEDVYIDVNCVFEGRVRLGRGVRVGPNCLLRDSEVQEGSTIHANSVLEQARVGADCSVGPFARLRPGTEMAAGAKVGNFVETKQARIGPHSKVNHLSYVGDTEIGEHANVGAGTITCNYDGVSKHRTVIGDGAFIGSNSSLVAPVTVGKGATVGAGSTVTDDVPDEQLAVARGRQRNIEGWQRPRKK